MIKEKSKIIRYGFNELKDKNNWGKLAEMCLRFKWIEAQSKNLSSKLFQVFVMTYNITTNNIVRV